MKRKIKQLNKEVLFNICRNIGVGYKEITFLKEKSRLNRRKRIRLCAHNNLRDKLHEMFIVHSKGAYIRPHKHSKKVESLHIIEGVADLILFHRKGNITDVIHMGDYSSGKKFYYRISDARFHTLIIKSKFFIFHETTLGPFNKECTVFAHWSPPESDNSAIRNFKKEISKAVKYFNNYYRN